MDKGHFNKNSIFYIAVFLIIYIIDFTTVFKAEIKVFYIFQTMIKLFTMVAFFQLANILRKHYDNIDNAIKSYYILAVNASALLILYFMGRITERQTTPLFLAICLFLIFLYLLKIKKLLTR